MGTGTEELIKVVWISDAGNNTCRWMTGVQVACERTKGVCVKTCEINMQVSETNMCKNNESDDNWRGIK